MMEGTKVRLERQFIFRVPMVRIHLPPAVSPQTIGSAGDFTRSMSAPPTAQGTGLSLVGTGGEEEKVRLVGDAAERTALANMDQVALGPRQVEEPPKSRVKTATRISPPLIGAVAVGIVLRQRGTGDDRYCERCG
jgi:hypothetical protein